MLSVHSGKKAELGQKDWDEVRDRLFSVDQQSKPRVIVSVLMLREGFDVSNICVIVPLRSASASILLEQTVGRGLRLMWRGDSTIEELKQESRDLIASKGEPQNYFDMLFIVEHPRFQEFYDELLAGGLAGELTDQSENVRATGDPELVRLREDFQKFDFQVPIILRDAEQEMRAPSIDPLKLSSSKYPLNDLLAQLGRGDIFTSQAVESGTQFGDYRVNGGVMTATGYNDYLSRLATRIAEAHARAFVTINQQYNKASQFPVLHSHRPLLIGWLDEYIKEGLFGEKFDPLEGENWRILLLTDVTEEMAGKFGALLVEMQENIQVQEAEVSYRRISEVEEVSVRSNASIEVKKSVFPKLPYPSSGGGLERDFMLWADDDSKVESFIKLHEYKHYFMRRPYLKADGMPAQYSPDFLVKTTDVIYVVETKAQSSLVDENVKRKQRSAVAWCEQINSLQPEQRGNRIWRYVLAGEQNVRLSMKNGARCSDFLEMAHLYEEVSPAASKLF